MFKSKTCFSCFQTCHKFFIFKPLITNVALCGRSQSCKVAASTQPTLHLSPTRRARERERRRSALNCQRAAASEQANRRRLSLSFALCSFIFHQRRNLFLLSARKASRGAGCVRNTFLPPHAVKSPTPTTFMRRRPHTMRESHRENWRACVACSRAQPFLRLNFLIRGLEM